MAGNLLGPREKYVYVSDDLKSYGYTTDEDLAVAGLGPADAAPTVYNPASPPIDYCGSFPRGFRPRVVFVQDAAGNRKELIAASPSADLYATNLAQNVTIDGVVFTTTGRRGEKMSF